MGPCCAVLWHQRDVADQALDVSMANGLHCIGVGLHGVSVLAQLCLGRCSITAQLLEHVYVVVIFPNTMLSLWAQQDTVLFCATVCNPFSHWQYEIYFQHKIQSSEILMRLLM